MLKVFLVEDEVVVRQGIKNNVDWEAHGYEFAGEASDGELAFPMIKNLKPDIVITDIRMPFMDGLALSRLIRRELPSVEIMILTGHADFEYAKEGIQIGISEYLTKPISGQDLLAAVDKVAEKILKRKEDEKLKAIYEKEMAGRHIDDKRRLFQELVRAEHDTSDLIARAGSLGIDISAVWYNIILFQMRSDAQSFDEYSGSVVDAWEAIERETDSRECIIFNRGLEGSAFLLKAPTEEGLSEIREKYLGIIGTALGQHKNIQYFGGIGKPVQRLRALGESFESARRAFAHRYLAEGSRILDSKSLAEPGLFRHDAFEFDPGSYERLDRMKLKDFLRFGSADDAAYFVEEYFSDSNQKMMESSIMRQYVTMDAYFCVLEFLKEMQAPEEKIARLPSFSYGVMENVENAVGYLKDLLTAAIREREENSDNRYRDLIAQAIQYIDENYANGDLSLNDLASHVNVSPNHLSMVFSQQTGHSFVKYLTDLRMNRAKELLLLTNRKSSEISEEVGYRDPHYFSFLFKKTQGMTPTQWRNAGNQ